MAVQIIHRLLSDLSGEEASTTVKFAVDGHDYSIDLTEAENEEFHELITKYTSAGMRAARARAQLQNSQRMAFNGTPAPVSMKQSDRVKYLADIRNWAADKGIKVAPRGRIPQSVTDMYENRHTLEAAAIAEAAEKVNDKLRKDTLDVVGAGKAPIKANGRVIKAPAEKRAEPDARPVSPVPAPVFSGAKAGEITTLGSVKPKPAKTAARRPQRTR